MKTKNKKTEKSKHKNQVGELIPEMR